MLFILTVYCVYVKRMQSQTNYGSYLQLNKCANAHVAQKSVYSSTHTQCQRVLSSACRSIIRLLICQIAPKQNFCHDRLQVNCCSLRLILFEFGSRRTEHAQCAAYCLQSVEQLSRVWNSNMAEAVVSLHLTNLEWFQIVSSHA